MSRSATDHCPSIPDPLFAGVHSSVRAQLCDSPTPLFGPLLTLSMAILAD